MVHNPSDEAPIGAIIPTAFAETPNLSVMSLFTRWLRALRAHEVLVGVTFGVSLSLSPVSSNLRHHQEIVSHFIFFSLS